MPKQKEKVKKVVKEESESEEEEASEKNTDSDVEKVEDSEEERSDKEEGSDDEDKSDKSDNSEISDDEDEDEDEDKDKEDDNSDAEISEDEDEGKDKEEASDDEEKSDKSEKSEKSESDKSESDDEDKSDVDESDDSINIKQKKKGGKKEKGKKENKKYKKDKKKEDDKKNKKPSNAIESKTTPALISHAASIRTTPTISSISHDLDELSKYLTKTFRSFQTIQNERLATFEPTIRKTQEEKERKEILQKPVQTLNKEQNTRNENTFNPLRSYGKIHSLPIYDSEKGFRDAKPLQDEVGIQYEPQVSERKLASPEAKRAVEEYKRRKELEKKGYKDESVGSIHDLIEPLKEDPIPTKNTVQGRPDNNPKYDENYRSVRKVDRKNEEEDYYVELKKRTYSPNKSGGQWSKSNQIAENYYSNVNRKLIKEPSPAKKTLQDLYKHKPKSRLLEDESQQIGKLNESGNKGYTSEKYDQGFRQTGQSLKNHQSVIDANRRQIDDALEVLVKKSRPNTKY